MFSAAAICRTFTLMLNLGDQEYIEHENLKETNSCSSLLTNLSTETSILNVGINSFPGPFNNYISGLSKYAGKYGPLIGNISIP